LPHKLLITRKLKPPSKYRKFLTENETVAGGITEFTYELKNIGSESIPEGDFVTALEKPIGMRTVTHTALPLKISTIKPNDTVVYKGRTRDLILPGTWASTIELRTRGKAKIQYYHTEKGEPFNVWFKPFYVIERHQLDLLSILEKLLKKEEE